MLKFGLQVENGDEIRRLFQSLITKGKNLTPVLRAIGEDLTASTKERFFTSTSPTGQRWAPNTATTLERYLGKFTGVYDKEGGLTKRGQARTGNKQPLIGETRLLSTTINYQIPNPYTLWVGSPMIYAATHQFGARRGAFGSTRRGAPIPWGDIPARPFLGLSTTDIEGIIASLRSYLTAE